MKQHDPYTIQSPWGAIAGFFVIQCFGFVTLQGFRMFWQLAQHGSDPLSAFNADGIADRILLPFWGGIWIFAFVAFQADMFRRITRFMKHRGFTGIGQALAAPAEIVKLIIAIVFAVVFVSFQFGRYPFPSRPVSTFVSGAFSLFSWVVSGIIAWGIRKGYDRQNPQEDSGTLGMVLGYIISVAFVALALTVTPGLFYFHGMLGLGVITILSCRLLFKRNERHGAEQDADHIFQKPRAVSENGER